MDIGDIVILGGKRFYLRGFDPAGVDPRLAYLEDAETGERTSAAFEELSWTTARDGVLRLVDDSQERPE